MFSCIDILTTLQSYVDYIKDMISHSHIMVVYNYIYR